ncbi:hypothetical protein V9L05_05395 [Bernardetia sp. Wsw4-3y2]|uniref:hypothetical protein n=1 Tax=Bernardetia sp. Wsw4-3y2 TaxID=3127471 RepID=UPI0030D144B1
MKKLLFCFSFVALLSSCDTKEVIINPIQKEIEISKNNERLIFSNQEEFNSTLNLLKNKTVEELQKWSKSKGIESLINVELSDKYDNFNFPNVLKAIINVNGEYQIGNSIAWYDNGFKHFAQSEEELKYIKQNPSLNTEKAKVESKIVTKKSDSELQRVVLGSNTLDARHQKTFFQNNNSGSERKYVHEVVCYTEYHNVTDSFFGSGYSSYSSVYVRVKLEFKTRGRWKPAGEKRNISYSLYGTYTLITDGVNVISGNFNQNSGRYNASGDLQIPIQSFGQGFSHTLPMWELEVNGSIDHSVVGDVASNRWINSGLPLW